MIKIELLPWHFNDGTIELRISLELMGEKQTYSKAMPVNDFLSHYELLMREATTIIRDKCLTILEERFPKS